MKEFIKEWAMTVLYMALISSMVVLSTATVAKIVEEGIAGAWVIVVYVAVYALSMSALYAKNDKGEL